MAEQKKTGCCKSLIVTGCLTQRYQDEVKKEIPEVDAILGTNSYDSIVEALEETLRINFIKIFIRSADCRSCRPNGRLRQADIMHI